MFLHALYDYTVWILRALLMVQPYPYQAIEDKAHQRQANQDDISEGVESVTSKDGQSITYIHRPEVDTLAKLCNNPSMGHIIFLTGASGTGKSTIAEKVADQLSAVQLIHCRGIANTELLYQELSAREASADVIIMDDASDVMDDLFLQVKINGCRTFLGKLVELLDKKKKLVFITSDYFDAIHFGEVFPGTGATRRIFPINLDGMDVNLAQEYLKQEFGARLTPSEVDATAGILGSKFSDLVELSFLMSTGLNLQDAIARIEGYQALALGSKLELLVAWDEHAVLKHIADGGVISLEKFTPLLASIATRLTRKDIATCFIEGETVHLVPASKLQSTLFAKKFQPKDNSLTIEALFNCVAAGYKKVSTDGVIGDAIAELFLFQDSKVSRTHGKKRCNKALVGNIRTVDGRLVKTASSFIYGGFQYVTGAVAEVGNFNEDLHIQCAAGIHFFESYQEALDYKW